MSDHLRTLSESKEIHPVTPTQEAYNDLVLTMRTLGDALVAATSAQYEAPPGAPAGRESSSEGKGIRNPTLDIVLDPRRLALSEEVSATAAALRRARATLDPYTERLLSALTRWEGTEDKAA